MSKFRWYDTVSRRRCIPTTSPEDGKLWVEYEGGEKAIVDFEILVEINIKFCEDCHSCFEPCGRQETIKKESE